MEKLNADCVKSGNPSLYCADTEDSFNVLSEEPKVKEEKEEPKPEDKFASFDIVKATQYGALDRIQTLVDSGEVDVNERDTENISLLHWASINNRTEISKYFLGHGAKVDAVGGELRSTPLHWAVRQGHLQMVVLLMQHGADPDLKDGEGCSGLHLAAQFGHTAIVAYLIAKQCHANDPDANGKLVKKLLFSMTNLIFNALQE